MIDLQKKSNLGRLRRVSMNRMNLGPFRNDTSAMWDLASHDMSIIVSLIEDVISIKTSEFSSHNSNYPGTCNLLAEWSGGSAEINVSWDYPSKCRSQTFIYDNAIIFWDDFRGIFRINGKNLDHVSDIGKPLTRSINFYLENDYKTINKRSLITKRVTSLLERGVDA